MCGWTSAGVARRTGAERGGGPAPSDGAWAGIEIATVAARPEWAQMLGQLEGLWPQFMSQDPTGGLYFGYHVTAYPEYVLIAVDRATGQPVAKAHSVPISWEEDPADGMPDGGWDWAIRTSTYDRLSGTTPTHRLRDRDLRPPGPPPWRPVRPHARRDAGQRGPAGLHRPRRAGAAERQARAPRRADRGVRHLDPRRRPAPRPVAAGARTRRRRRSSTSRTPA